MSQKRIPASVGKFLVGPDIGGITLLTFTRSWQKAKGRVLTALGATTIADIAIRNGAEAATTILVVPGQGHPNYAVPTALLDLDNIRFRVADDGKAMAHRVAVQKAETGMLRAQRRVLKAYGLTFGN